MPVLDILDQSGRLIRGNRAGIVVVATMAFPLSETKRQAYEAGVLQEHMLQEDRPIPPKIARLVTDHGGKPGLDREVAKAFDLGYLAGMTLVCVLQLEDHGSPNASLRKAQHLVREVLNTREGTKPPGNTRLEEAWSKFRSVAHLWAAALPRWENKTTHDNLFRDDLLPDLLADAHWFAAKACHMSPAHGKGPLLNEAEIWAVPTSSDIPMVTLEAPRMSELELSWLDEYDSTNRHRI